MLALAALGCGETLTSRSVTGTPGPAHTGSVRIAMGPARVPAGFSEIALIQARGVWSHATLERVFAGLREECAALGGNLVFRVRIDQGAFGAQGTGLCGHAPPN